MSGSGETVSDVGEAALVERIAARFGPAPEDETWSGDDAALIRSPAQTLIYTTDLVVEDVDFDLSLCGPEDVGWKAVAVNVSDVAAMGGRPTHALATLGLRTDTPLGIVDGIIEGMHEAARSWGVAVVGGDISSARELSLGVALLGAPVAGGPVRRSGARPGDAICVTGALGGAAGGLVALRRHEEGFHDLVRRQLRPRPRPDEAERLCAVGVTSMIDISDGMALDLGRLMEASGTGCRVEAEAVPVDPALVSLRAAIDDPELAPLELALGGGEDFELLFTISEEAVERAVSALQPLGTPVTRIGTVQAEGRMLGEEPLQRWEERGWDHLRAR